MTVLLSRTALQAWALQQNYIFSAKPSKGKQNPPRFVSVLVIQLYLLCPDSYSRLRSTITFWAEYFTSTNVAPQRINAVSILSYLQVQVKNGLPLA